MLETLTIVHGNHQQTNLRYMWSASSAPFYPTPFLIFPAVISADVTAWIRRLSMKEAPNLYVEVAVEESLVQHTKLIQRNETPSWNENFQLYVLSHSRMIGIDGLDSLRNASSTIYLSIKHGTPKLSAQDRCLGSVNITTSSLLTRSLNNAGMYHIYKLLWGIS